MLGELIWGWPIALVLSLLRLHERPKMTYEDLDSAEAGDLGAEASAVAVAKQANDDAAAKTAAASASTIAYAAAIHAAPAGFVVNFKVNPPVLLTSADGLTYTRTAIASITDPVPGP